MYGSHPGLDEVPATVDKYHKTVKEAVKERVIFENDTLLHNHVKTLVKQGHFLDLLRTSFTDATWQSFIYDLPKGTMKFLLNSYLDTLPTLANLQSWAHGARAQPAAAPCPAVGISKPRITFYRVVKLTSTAGAIYGGTMVLSTT